jgi:hypothetical protein
MAKVLDDLLKRMTKLRKELDSEWPNNIEFTPWKHRNTSALRASGQTRSSLIRQIEHDINSLRNKYGIQFKNLGNTAKLWNNWKQAERNYLNLLRANPYWREYYHMAYKPEIRNKLNKIIAANRKHQLLKQEVNRRGRELTEPIGYLKNAVRRKRAALWAPGGALQERMAAGTAVGRRSPRAQTAGATALKKRLRGG